MNRRLTISLILALSVLLTPQTGCSILVGDAYADRSEWGPWRATGSPCSKRAKRNTREEMLVKHSKKSALVFKTDKRCKVKSGRWLDQATGKTFTNPRDLDLDHIVPIDWANDHGGAEWPSDKKRRFYNDTNNLWLIDKSANRSKGAKPPWLWMPARRKTRCWYVRQFARVVRSYRLGMTAAEKKDIARVEKTVCRR